MPTWYVSQHFVEREKRNLRKHIGNCNQISAELLDVVAVTGGAAADPAFAAVVTPDP